ncbi:MAG TPA: kelch repeat-containing protein, partial [Bacteroidia bacterium]|nr:kelch repeat-containing protein [Bacteroidia bacterium]
IFDKIKSMKKIITAIVFCFLFSECFSQAGEWVWIKGSNVGNQPGNFGVQGVPGPANNPPGVYEPCEWIDLNGNLWILGGMNSNAEPYGDLWKYDPLSNEWTWMKGPGILNPLPVYGIQGVSSPLNNPGGTYYGVTSFIDLQGNLWMFDGRLWRYDISTNEWTWMKGSGWQGVYGIQGVPDTANYPGGRSECVSGWTDIAGDLWLFAGAGGFNQEPLNDLWRYTISTNTWTWMKGDSTVSGIGNYGTMGIENAANNPPARYAYTNWKDSAGNLWFFGGGLYDSLGNRHTLNDLWRYNPVTNNWTWMSGSDTLDAAGIYGIKCNGDSSTIPGSRFESPAGITDSNNDFWLFGGFSWPDGRNDLWKYCVASGEWTWISGDSIGDPAGNGGTLGVSSPANKPDCRIGGVAWFDGNNHIYIFGGQGLGGRYSDLWKYTIDTACGACPIGTGTGENNPPEADELFVFPNPANSSFTISFSSAGSQIAELRIYNTLGNRVYFSEEESAAGKFEKEINVEKWSSGIYFLSVWTPSERVKTGGRILSRKIVVSR